MYPPPSFSHHQHFTGLVSFITSPLTLAGLFNIYIYIFFLLLLLIFLDEATFG